jgi:hypothetical protein
MEMYSGTRDGRLCLLKPDVFDGLLERGAGGKHYLYAADHAGMEIVGVFYAFAAER